MGLLLFTLHGFNGKPDWFYIFILSVLEGNGSHIGKRLK